MAAIVAVGAGYSQIYGSNYQEWTKLSRAAKNLSKSTISFCGPEVFIPRSKIEEQLHNITESEQRTLNKTILVVGQRGVDKSTLVKSAFQNRSGVVINSTAQWTLNTALASLFRSLNVDVKASSFLTRL